MLEPGRAGCSVFTTAAVNMQQWGWQDLEVGVLKVSILLDPWAMAVLCSGRRGYCESPAGCGSAKLVGFSFLD